MGPPTQELFLCSSRIFGRKDVGCHFICVLANPVDISDPMSVEWRWSWKGEEDKGEKMERFAVQLAGLADVYVNDAFGSWQSHASTYYITRYIPSFMGLCMQVSTINFDFRASILSLEPFKTPILKTA